jgi:hypothetical protein
MKNQPEYILQKQICKFLKLQYPNVFFLSDTIASVYLTAPQAQRNKDIQNSNFHCPDLLILQPNKTYKGLFIELKVITPFKKNGAIKASKNDHLLNQQKSIDKLNSFGYCAFFSWGFEDTVNLIKSYFQDELKLKTK